MLAPIVISIAALMCGEVCAEPEVFTYGDLVVKLKDLRALAVLPSPGEKTGSWTSYNRSSRYDEVFDTYENWDANWDNLGHIRQEGEDLVLAEMEGPGCIWRIWSAEPDDGQVRVYLDDNLFPAIALPFRDFFNGTHSPFSFPELVYSSAAEGKNNYIPIPYQHSCKIVAEPEWGWYYHFNYSTFPQGTAVPTFTMNLGQEELNMLSAVNDFFLLSRGDSPYPDDGVESGFPYGHAVRRDHLYRYVRDQRIPAHFPEYLQETAVFHMPVI